MSEEFVNQLHYGDNLVRLRGEGVDKPIPDEVADLIYLDPPFNSQRQYSLLFKQHKGQDSPAQIMAFEDTWTFSGLLYDSFMKDERNGRLKEVVGSLHKILGDSDMMAYVLMMAPRLLELHRKLKDTGSLYLHCDPVASHYLKIILDVVFGPQNFINEIIWKRSYGHGDSRRSLGRTHDTILFYAKGSRYKLNRFFHEHRERYLKDFFRHQDEMGRYKLENLTSPNDRPNLKYEYRGYPFPAKGWRVKLERMQELDAQNRLHFPTKEGGRIMKKVYLHELEGQPMTDIWTDINLLSAHDKERRGYPTQKPLGLLERIIAASTDEGDVVLDPFAGCGTAIVAAERMNRKWIGIDVTYLAINEIVNRLMTEKHHDRALAYKLLGTPEDEDAAKALFRESDHQNHKPFEQWAVTLVGGRYNDKKGADRGVDGVIDLQDIKGEYRKGLIQVKGGAGLSLSNVRDFAHVIERENAVFGIMLAQKEPTPEMVLAASKLGYADWPGSRKTPRYQILTTQGILERGEQAIVPESWLIGPDKGVGKAVRGQTRSLFDPAEPDEPE